MADHWGHYAFNSDMLDLSICAKEAHVLLTMLHTHRALLTGRRVRVFCDNMNVVRAVVRR